MRKLLSTMTALVLATGCGDAGGVDPDAIDASELAAVRLALDSALADDTLYPTLSLLVFPYIDRASFITAGADTTRIVGIEFDIRAFQAPDSLIADFTAVLGWRGYRPASRTVDSVFFLLGAGRAPVDDSLRTRFSPDTAGTATGFVIHQAPDSTLTLWLARGGRLRTTAASYGSGLELTEGVDLFRGTLMGDFTITARRVPDSLTTVTSLKDFGSGARALKVQIRAAP